jgi:hypothetical protein
MKLFEHPEEEKTLDRLPDLPEGLEVPDDISGLHPPTTPQPTTGGVRWMRWLAAVVLLAGAGVLTAVLVRGDNPDPAQVDYLEVYGTDNPTFVEGNAPGSVEIVATVDYMEVYGTDNPVFVPAGADVADTGEFMRLYGTDNPTFVEPSYMELYGTDNPTFVEP